MTPEMRRMNRAESWQTRVEIHRRRVSIATRAVVLVLLLSSPAIAADGPVSHLDRGIESDPGKVTWDNLYESERFWPYRIELVEAWRPAGHEGRFGWGVGILVRVEPSGLLRVDFGADGKHLVPAGATNVIVEANRIRTGEVAKRDPNFLVATGTRLLDAGKDPIQPVSIDSLREASGFLVLFVDPASEDFDRIAPQLEPLRGLHRVETILFPQGDARDARVAELCKSAGWRGAFLFDRFSPAYTASYLAADASLPRVVLITPEAREILSVEWREGVVESVRSAIEVEWGNVPSPSPD